MSNVYFITFILGLIAVSAFVIIHKHSNTVVIPGISNTSNKHPTFVVAGLSNSGKTTLFNYLTTGKIIPTVMSQDVNATNHYKLPSSGDKKLDFKLIEFPGHAKLQNLLFEEIKTSKNIKGLIYLIDSSIDPKNFQQVSKLLYEILLISERRPGGIDILVACNKSDLFSARQANKIKDLLEQEIDSIRRLNSSNISKVDESNEEDENLGQSINSKFKFENLEGNVDVVSGSVLKNKLDKWECWIDERSVN